MILNNFLTFKFFGKLTSDVVAVEPAGRRSPLVGNPVVFGLETVRSWMMRGNTSIKVHFNNKVQQNYQIKS